MFGGQFVLIWAAVSYIAYYLIEEEHKMLCYFGAASNTILAIAYSYAYEIGASTSSIFSAAVVLNIILMLMLFVFLRMPKAVLDIIEAIKHTIKRLNY